MEETKPILVISPSSFPGSSGDSANYSELILGLSRKCYQVLFVCPRSHLDKSYDKRMRREGIRIVRIPASPPRLIDFGKRSFGLLSLKLLMFYVTCCLLVLFLLIRYRIRSVIMRHSILTLPFCLLFPLFRISIFADGELLTGNRVDVSPTLGRVWRLLEILEPFVVKKYSAYLISNEAQKKNLARLGLSKKRIFERKIGINTCRMPKYDLLSIPRKTFGYFGTLEKWQNVEHLIKSFLRVIPEHQNIKLLIIGNGSRKKYLKQLVEKNKAVKNILFFEAVPREELWKSYFPKFRVAIIPRSSTLFAENSSIKLVEALAAGKPTIASRVPGISAMVDEGDGVIFVEPDDVSSMSNAILRFIDNDDLLLEFSQKALHGSKRFAVDVQLVRLLNLVACTRK